MKKWLKYKDIILLSLMLGVLALSYFINQSQSQAPISVDLPVTRVTEDEAVQTALSSKNALQTYQEKRAAQRQQDIETLQKMLDNGQTTEQTRIDGEQALQNIIKNNEMELALEGVLTGSGFSPCVCVVQDGQVTVMVARQSLTSGEASLILTMAQSQTGAQAGNIKILTSDMF